MAHMVWYIKLNLLSPLRSRLATYCTPFQYTLPLPPFLLGWVCIWAELPEVFKKIPSNFPKSQKKSKNNFFTAFLSAFGGSFRRVWEQFMFLKLQNIRFGIFHQIWQHCNWDARATCPLSPSPSFVCTHPHTHSLYFLLPHMRQTKSL